MAVDNRVSPAFAGPLYRQVAAMLRAKICAAEWTARAPLPNEVVLARDAGVSIGTMRKALEILENERLIERRQGRGTFVVEPSADTEVARFSNLVIGGRRVKAETVRWSASEAVADDEEVFVLRAAQGAIVYRLVGVWRAGKRLAAVERVSVLKSRFPDLPRRIAEAGQFLFPVYRRDYSQVVTKVAESIVCGVCDERTADLLKVPAGVPSLEIRRIAYGLGGDAIELARRSVLLGEASYVVAMD